MNYLNTIIVYVKSSLTQIAVSLAVWIRKPDQALYLYCLLTCCIVVAAYHLLIFNRFFPIVEGWYHVYSHYVSDGALPYRDFHYFLPPFYLYLVVALTSIMGDSFTSFRALGIFLEVLLAAGFFLLFARIFKAQIASFITILVMLYYQSTVVHISYDFLHWVFLFTIYGTYFICRYFDYPNRSFKSREGLKTASYLILAGILGSLALLTKQSGGLFSAAFFYAAVLFVSFKQGRWHAVGNNLGLLSIGTLLPILVTFLWLADNNLLPLFWQQVIVGAASGKGGLSTILFGWITRLLTQQNVTLCIITGLIVLAFRLEFFPGNIQLKLRNHLAPPPLTIQTILLIIGMASITLIGIYAFYVKQSWSYNIISDGMMGYIYYTFLIPVATAATFIGFTVFIYRYYKVEYFGDRDTLILLVVTIGQIWGTGTAATVSEVALLIIVGLLAGWLLSLKSRFYMVSVGAFALCLALIFFSVSLKFTTPYMWWGIGQPDIRTATTSIDLPQLNGLRVSSDTAAMFEEVVALVASSTNPGDEVYTFPNIPVFNLLTDRYPGTFATVAWYDVLADNYAEDDAQYLLDNPPKAIIYLDVPEWVWQGHEIAFRNGQPSGQRQIKSVIEYLTTNGNYSFEASYAMPHGYSLEVWLTYSP